MHRYLRALFKPKPSSAQERGLPGFSLVEIAIAMMVIGLVVTGVMKGADLIETAKLRSVVSQVAEIRMATQTFYDRFGYLPGDFPKARSMIHESLVNGDGTGALTGSGLRLAGYGSAQKSGSFWRHLYKSNLYTASGEAAVGSELRFGQGVPAAKIGGGFTVTFVKNKREMRGNWLVLGEVNGQNNFAAGLTPLQAYAIDRQADTGFPTTGNIRARDGEGQSTGSCVKNGEYNTKNTAKSCILYFKIAS